jgi:hypothetical protein
MINIYKYSILLILIITSSCGLIAPLHASQGKGNIRKLKGLSDSMGEMDAHGKVEGVNYQKANTLLANPDIARGMSGDDLIKICGEPVARADNGTRWVYKPPTSTFFEGEKIYFYFDQDQKLLDWEKVYQK